MESHNELAKQAARTTVDTLVVKLESAIQHLSKHVVDGRLSEGDQYAVRVLRSRQRLLQRLFLFLHGTPAEKEIAKIELYVKSGDRGELVQMGEKNHGPGRLDCRACDRGEDNAILAKLCFYCQMGIMHVYTVRRPTPVVGPGSGVLNAPATRYEAPNEGLYVVQVFECDNCRAVENVDVGFERFKEERMREFRL